MKIKTKMVRGMIPQVRLDCENSRKLALALNSFPLVIPIYDLICNDTGKPNQLFKKIKDCGGLHNFLNYSGTIILSSIMRDDLIKKIKLPEEYAEIIKGSKPNFYFTPDGLTYENKDEDSLKEIIRLSKLTLKLKELCPEIQPIGLVKGSNYLQIKAHKNFLKKLGVKVFAFHTGDFFRNGDEKRIQTAKYYCSLIKEEGNLLMLYGLGSPKRMLEFSFADFFITYTHFVTARNGNIFEGSKKINYSNMSVYEAAIYNFKELSNHLKKLQYQTKLFIGGECKWAVGQQEQQYIIQSLKVKA